MFLYRLEKGELSLKEKMLLYWDMDLWFRTA